MTKQGALEKYVRSADEELAFAEETAMAHTALAVAQLLTSTNMTQRALAERVGVSEARISQILCADSNPTVKTIARIGHALGRRMTIEFPSPPRRHEEPKPWPHRLRLVPQRWECSNDESEEVAETGIAA